MDVPTGVFVYSINSGTDGSESQDQWSSFFGDVNQQVETACEKLGGIEELSGGYNAVGFSQGGSFLRVCFFLASAKFDSPVARIFGLAFWF